MATLSLRQELSTVSTVVVKVGSRILIAEENLPHVKRIRMLVDDIAQILASGLRVLLVSSGAIAHGMRAIHLSKRPTTIPEKQACASIGQIRLMHLYESLFSKHNIPIGQVLLTWDDLRDKKRYLNLRNTLFTLFDFTAVPIINENDSVGIEEMRFGENDTLAAQISLLIQADLFVNLTDVSGLHDGNPIVKKDTHHIPVVSAVTPTVYRYASESKNEISVGGMTTKLKAAEMVTSAGMYALIGDGFHRSLLDVLGDPSAGTLFLPSGKKMSSRHRWIAFAGRPNGIIVIDKGAQKAIVEKGKSLLPAGVKKIIGSFNIGDMVDLQDESRRTVARGLVNYPAAEAAAIAGCRTADIAGKIGQKTFDEIIHRDNLVVLNAL